MSILIKNGRIIDPSQNIDEIKDIFIKNNKIVSINSKIKETANTIIDATDKIISPGFIDMHTHLREPGEENKETIETGLLAALSGGFTTVCAMPNTIPPCDNQSHVNFLLNKTKKLNLANVIPIGTITKKRQGKEISEMHELKQAGCLAISDDGNSVDNPSIMRKALEYASMLDLLVISHCEDKQLAKNGVMHEGYWSTILGMKPIPDISESIIVNRDIQLAKLTNARIHIAHISTKKSLDIVKQAKKDNINVTAEVTPHHFTLKDEDIKDFNTNMKVNPPLRSNTDIAAIKNGIKNNIIDTIATDHAPHLEHEKEKEFDYAPFGMIGLETALSLSIMELINTKIINWPTLINMLSTKPAQILKYNRGTLKENTIADITIIDPTKKWIYKKENIVSKSKNSPFINWELQGKVTHTIVNGNIIYKMK